MSSEFTKNLRVSVFGQSHGDAIGVSVDSFPEGEDIDLVKLQEFMERRRGGKSPLSTQRSEKDIPEFLSGIKDSKTCGTPLCAIIRNEDKRSSDYEKILDVPRPGHADLTAFYKWKGQADMRGGGHFSGRLTAPLCVAGGIAKQILERRGIHIGAHLYCVENVYDRGFDIKDGEALFGEISKKEFPVIDDESGEKMKASILAAKADGDSVGGIIECMAVGVPEGLGDPMFDGVENRIASAVFGIPAVKGIEFGRGFEAAHIRGSENNDAYRVENGKIKIQSNNAGGILGGITNGMPVTFKLAIKPTPSIAKEQESVSLSKMQNASLSVSGRHDPCIAQRAVPVVEAVTALVILDMLMD